MERSRNAGAVPTNRPHARDNWITGYLPVTPNSSQNGVAQSDP